MNIFEGKDILVTGGCGSIGSEIVKQLLKYEPRSVRVFDSNESGHFYLNQKVKSNKIRNLIGSVRDLERLKRAMNGVHIVFHAAALKHVPFCEYNPFEAVSTNVLGTQNAITAAIENKVEKFITISTDKAVNPINTMGATKLLAEKITIDTSLSTSDTKFACVRFGNVLDSVGSVIPIFRQQIKEQNHLTITSDKMTRFFMTMEDAVTLVLKSAEIMKGQETFILKMKALRIMDLAEVMVEELASKHGKNAADFSFKVIGVRPGEKIHEALITKSEASCLLETDDMFILNNRALMDYGSRILDNSNKFIECNTEEGKLLNKEEVRSLLYAKGILK